MDITVKQPINATIYVENVYRGNSLFPDDLKIVESIPWNSWMQDWLGSMSLTSDWVKDCELSLRLTGDRQIQELNARYRSMNRPTDVLAFAATEADLTIPNLAEPTYLGDIVISLDTALRQATEQQHSIVVELAWLSSHGLLHLLGWDHPDNRSLEQMLKRQWELIQLSSIQEY